MSPITPRMVCILVKSMYSARRLSSVAMPHPKAKSSTSSLMASNAPPVRSMQNILAPSLLQALDHMGIQTLTPVQSQVLSMPSLRKDWLVKAYKFRGAWPVANDSLHSLVRSKTGTGKTIAFLLPSIQNLLDHPSKKGCVTVLVLSPTRELALQIAAEAERLVSRSLLEGRAIEVHTAFGGTARASNLTRFRKGDPKVLVATPGRLNDYLGEPDVSPKFSDIKTVVLDEADAMLEAGKQILTWKRRISCCSLLAARLAQLTLCL